MAAASLLVGVPRRGGLPVSVVKAAERMPDPGVERRLGEREDTEEPRVREPGVLVEDRRSLTVSARARVAARLLPRWNAWPCCTWEATGVADDPMEAAASGWDEVDAAEPLLGARAGAAVRPASGMEPRPSPMRPAEREKPRCVSPSRGWRGGDGPPAEGCRDPEGSWGGPAPGTGEEASAPAPDAESSDAPPWVPLHVLLALDWERKAGAEEATVPEGRGRSAAYRPRPPGGADEKMATVGDASPRDDAGDRAPPGDEAPASAASACAFSNCWAASTASVMAAHSRSTLSRCIATARRSRS
mmetsp:Transcript_9021/g.35326  ORF Transcript_9021/g.35326 Transcript_9021/m.35326 type:complete len:302 (+) Transcript_9021:599-1504(+)